MAHKILATTEDVFGEFQKEREFLEAERKTRPYYDLLLQIIQRRKELGLTQKDLSTRANTFQSRISKIESGEHDIRLSTLIDIAEALETEVMIQLVSVDAKEPEPAARIYPAHRKTDTVTTHR